MARAELSDRWEAGYYIYIHEVIATLAFSDEIKSHSDKEKYIKDCFDSFFYYVQMVEQSIQNKLFKQRDITFPLSYYADILRKPIWKEVIINYLLAYKYQESIDLFARFGAWNN